MVAVVDACLLLLMPLPLRGVRSPLPAAGRPDSGGGATVDCSVGVRERVHGKCYLCLRHGRCEQRVQGRAGRHLPASGLHCRGGGGQEKLDFQGRGSPDAGRRPVLPHIPHDAEKREWPMFTAPRQLRPATEIGRLRVRLQLQRLLEGKPAQRCATWARHLPGTDFPWQVCRRNAWLP